MDKKKGWIILNSRNEVEFSSLLGKIIIKISRNRYMGKQKIRISRKTLNEVYDLLNKKTQRIRK